MELQTKLPIKPILNAELQDSFLNMGSCFARHLHEHLKHYGMNSFWSPFGICYNPMVMAQQLVRLTQPHPYEESDLGKSANALYFSYDHHGDYNGPVAQDVLDTLNRELSACHHRLANLRFLVLTLGTSYVYRLKESRKVVANCHKQPPHLFTRELISASESSGLLEQAIIELRKLNPQLQIILTVSPIRHLRDDACENTLSKAHLIIACHELGQKLENCTYFPAYELMMDELRDYRFYAEDMTHPSPLAVRYILERFEIFLLSDNSKKVLGEIKDLRRREAHRPQYPELPEAQIFRHKTALIREKILSKYPFLDLA